MIYTIAFSEDPEEFVKKVRELMKKGWIPQGGVSHDTVIMSNNRLVVTYCQAFVFGN
jgi:hypothetical protein